MTNIDKIELISFTDREKQLLELIRGNEYATQTSLAKEMGICSSYARHIIEKCSLKIRASYYRMKKDNSPYVELRESKSRINFIRKYQLSN